MKKIILIIFLIIIISISGIAIGYSPEITGRLEIGDRLDTEFEQDYYEGDWEEEYFDYHDYLRFWLRYRQQLAVGEYYFIRAQYYKRDNRERDYYSNITLDLWSNYTFYLTDELRNRINFDIKEKRYYKSLEKSYMTFNLKYQLDYQYSSIHKYSFYIQRRWNRYRYDSTRDNNTDVISIDWDYIIRPNLDISSNLRLDRQIQQLGSSSTNKYGRRIAINFRYRL